MNRAIPSQWGRVSELSGPSMGTDALGDPTVAFAACFSPFSFLLEQSSSCRSSQKFGQLEHPHILRTKFNALIARGLILCSRIYQLPDLFADRNLSQSDSLLLCNHELCQRQSPCLVRSSCTDAQISYSCARPIHRVLLAEHLWKLYTSRADLELNVDHYNALMRSHCCLRDAIYISHASI